MRFRHLLSVAPAMVAALVISAAATPALAYRGSHATSPTTGASSKGGDMAWFGSEAPSLTSDQNGSEAADSADSDTTDADTTDAAPGGLQSSDTETGESDSDAGGAQ